MTQSVACLSLIQALFLFACHNAGAPSPPGPSESRGATWLKYAITVDAGSMVERCSRYLLWRQASAQGACIEARSTIVNEEFNGLVVDLWSQGPSEVLLVASRVDATGCPSPPDGERACPTVRIELTDDQGEVSQRLWLGLVELVSMLPPPTPERNWPTCRDPMYGMHEAEAKSCALLDSVWPSRPTTKR